MLILVFDVYLVDLRHQEVSDSVAVAVVKVEECPHARQCHVIGCLTHVDLVDPKHGRRDHVGQPLEVAADHIFVAKPAPDTEAEELEELRI